MSMRPPFSFTIMRSFLLPAAALLFLIGLTGCPHQINPDCLGTPSSDLCNATIKQAAMHQFVVGDLGRANRTGLMMVELSLSSLKTAQSFVCQAQVLRDGLGTPELSSAVTLEVRPASLGCRAVENGDALHVRCQPGAGEPKAIARIVPASDSSELIKAALICTPEPVIPARAVAAAPDTSSAGDSTSGGAGRRTTTTDGGNRRVRTPQQRHPQPGGHKETHEDASTRVALPTVQPQPLSPSPSPSITPSPPPPSPEPSPPTVEPPAARTFGIDAVGELPRLVLTLVTCDDPHFHNGAGGKYNISGFQGKFHVADAGQCQIALVSGVKSDDEVKKIKGSIALHW